jgi:hypothetical protein
VFEIPDLLGLKCANLETLIYRIKADLQLVKTLRNPIRHVFYLEMRPRGGDVIYGEDRVSEMVEKEGRIPCCRSHSGIESKLEQGKELMPIITTS